LGAAVDGGVDEDSPEQAVRKAVMKRVRDRSFTVIVDCRLQIDDWAMTIAIDDCLLTVGDVSIHGLRTAGFAV
jgi:hypothetical protein